jgi:sulfane dehydrogenase subunit SoxC
MMRDTADQNRRLSGETESGPAQGHAHVEVPPESTNAMRFERRARRGPVRLTRRGVLESMVGAMGGLVLGGLGHERVAAADLPSYPVPDDPTKVGGRPPSPYGFRSQFETAERILDPTPVNHRGSSATPLYDARGIITPSSMHFEVHHGGVPTIDPAKHTLLIHGMVKRPLKFTVYDLICTGPSTGGGLVGRRDRGPVST